MSIKRLTYSTYEEYDVDETDEVGLIDSVESKVCPLCQTSFRNFTYAAALARSRAASSSRPLASSRSLELLLCPACGWWHLDSLLTYKGSDEERALGAKWLNDDGTVTARDAIRNHAVYSEIALDSPSLSIEQLRQHLARFWEQRKHISAQQAEDLVASVLRDHYDGDVLRVTANANAPDGGIDLLISSKDGIVQRAVQVKRRITQLVEPIEDVRNFIGAMMLSGSSNGVFVTTAAKFSRNASAVPSNLNLGKHRLNLELIDGERLLELLDYTNLRGKVRLPPLIEVNQEWIGDDGVKFDIRKLLFGELSRLFLS